MSGGKPQTLVTHNVSDDHRRRPRNPRVAVAEDATAVANGRTHKGKAIWDKGNDVARGEVVDVDFHVDKARGEMVIDVRC